MKKQIMKGCIAFGIAAATAMPSFADNLVQMPNPMRPYNTYNEMAASLSFKPLFLAGAPEFKETARYTIGSISDIRYRGKEGKEISIRTMYKPGVEISPESLSGLYGGRWKPVRIGQTAVLVTKLANGIKGAAWTNGGYFFSVTANGIDGSELKNILRYRLIPVTEWLYV